MESYENNYDDLRLYPERPVTVSVLFGIIGAVVGALPGFGLWLLLARLNIVSAYCGALLAFGTIFGYSFMTKKDELPAALGIIVCIAVMAGAVYLAECIDWAWEIADVLKNDVYSDFESSMREYGLFSEAEIKSAYRESMREEFGFSEATFSNCFFNLGSLLEYCAAKSKFYISLAQSGLFALLGGVFGFKKFGK